ncbi:MAG: ribonuclease HI family protein [Bacteroidetes bacterium]|nr:ribonuclease HI family protein [Bacteroidota bacterium]
MTIYAFIDGASRGNPGESGIGVLLHDSEGNVVQELSAYIGMTTNNVAEYMALLAALELAQKQKCGQLVVQSDSELLVRQMCGMYKVRNERLKQLKEIIDVKIATTPFDVCFRHVPREKNMEADALANRGIDEKRQVPRGIHLPSIMWGLKKRSTFRR